jgi:ATP-dependent RNA helicase SUPV3L1/SUV3
MYLSYLATKPPRLDRAKNVAAVLGPTNTGKTHYAIGRMLSHESGMIGLPLRLLAREVFNRVVEKTGPQSVALITGEEKIKPKGARYYVSTVEAMPRDLDLDFVAVDEIQLAADLDRGHVFTDRLLNQRGREETLLIGAATMQRTVQELLPGLRVLSRPRLSKLTFAGKKKMTRLPLRSAIVAFSAEEVYAIAEWIRRQRGGAAVVLGALSPRTRNAQVEMFQSGDVDYIVATDAIGMGLNLDVDHIAFAADRKFDGWQHRRLTPAEFGQIAGRAGRRMQDGTFGTTGRCPPFDEDLVEALEDHCFDTVRMLQWRNSSLDFSSIPDLLASLDVLPRQPGLTRAPLAEDQMVLAIAARDEKVVRETKTRADIARLWDCCQIPDYRKLSPAAHAELVLSIYGFVVRAGQIPDDWFASHIGALDRVDGDLDALSARIAKVRTWTFIANRSDWLLDPEHWQGITRQVEDTLSDALHARLAQRFVDRRASVLMRRLRENAMLEAEITTSGDVLVEGQHVGQLNGFRFAADPHAIGEAAKALNAAAQKALASEIESRASRVHEAVDEAFVLANDGIIRWLGEPVAKISAGAHVLEPTARILADDQLTGSALATVQRRLDLWLAQHVKKLLGALTDLEKAEGVEGLARGVAFQVAEALGVLDRAKVADDVKALPQDGRAGLRKCGVRFGAYHLYLPNLLKPAPRALAAQLWALTNGGVDEVKGLEDVPHLAASGRTSFVADKEVQKGFYRAAGFKVCGERAVRVDILERLADLIRPAIAYRPGVTPGDPPAGAADGDGFVVTVAMTSLAGCSGESFASILRSLGFLVERRAGPPITVPLLAKAATEPLARPPVASKAEETPLSEARAAPKPEPESTEPDPGDAAVVASGNIERRTASGLEQAALRAPSDVTARDGHAQIQGESDPPPEAQTQSQDFASSREQESGAAIAGDAAEPIGAADTVANAAETPGPMMIDVWRPHRPHHHPRRLEARAGKRPDRHHEASARLRLAESDRRADQTGESEGSGRQIPAEVSAAESAAPSWAHDGQSSPPGESRPLGDETERPPESPIKRGQRRPRFEGQRDRREGGSAATSASGRLNESERRQGRGAPSAREKKSYDRSPDPNSPFAKLLVLKASLEEKNKQDS